MTEWRKKPTLDEDFGTLVGFEGSKIKPFGKIKLPIILNNKQFLIYFFIVDFNKNIGFLGRQNSINLNLIQFNLNKNLPVIINNVQEESLPCVFKNYSNLFIGTSRWFTT